MTEDGKALSIEDTIGDIAIATSADLGKISLAMARRSAHQLDIVSRGLDPVVYDTRDFLDAVKHLVLSRRGQVRIIVLDADALISRDGHRLVGLAMRVSSFMEIRSPGESHAEFNEAMMIADRLSVIHRHYSDRYEGIANFHAPQWAALLSSSFESIWQNAEPIPHFRRLML